MLTERMRTIFIEEAILCVDPIPHLLLLNFVPKTCSPLCMAKTFLDNDCCHV